MTEDQWLECDDSLLMLESVPAGVSYRKQMHFALRCCDRVLDCIVGNGQRWVLRLAEDLADGDSASGVLACGSSPGT